MSQNAWVLVPKPHLTSIIGYKWVLKIKLNADGTIRCYKALLVSLNNHQEHGENFFDTFSPVAKSPTFCVLLTIAITHHWPILQLDVSMPSYMESYLKLYI